MEAHDAYKANLKRAHECLVEAKGCLAVAAQQTPNEDLAQGLTAATDTTQELIYAVFGARFGSVAS